MKTFRIGFGDSEEAEKVVREIAEDNIQLVKQSFGRLLQKQMSRIHTFSNELLALLNIKYPSLARVSRESGLYVFLNLPLLYKLKKPKVIIHFSEVRVSFTDHSITVEHQLGKAIEKHAVPRHLKKIIPYIKYVSHTGRVIIAFEKDVRNILKNRIRYNYFLKLNKHPIARYEVVKVTTIKYSTKLYLKFKELLHDYHTVPIDIIKELCVVCEDPLITSEGDHVLVDLVGKTLWTHGKYYTKFEILPSTAHDEAGTKELSDGLQIPTF